QPNGDGDTSEQDGSGGDSTSPGAGGTADGGGGTTGSTGGGTGTGGAPGSGGESSGSGGASGGSSSTCTPNPSGTFVVDGDLVLDEVTCLTWMQGWITSDEAKDAVVDAYPGATRDDAVATCESLSLGGYDDFRLPTLGEIATIATRCLDWGNDPPWAPEFETTGAVWTDT